MNENKYFRSKKSMLKKKKKFLSILGTTFTVENGSISFKYNGLQYLFISETSDPYYFRLILPNIGEVNSGNETQMSQVVNQMNLEIKAAKATISNNRIWVSIEQFVYSKDNQYELFRRSITVLEASINIFRQKIEEL